MPSPFRMLCVFAHPDDECYGPGGTIARYALGGVDVHILMFTCGEAGSIGVSKELPADELCRRRRVEFAAACDALSVASHRIVGVPDKGVASVPASEAVAEILAEIERISPQVTLTFHKGGVSGHPDHIAVARFLDQAVDAAGERGPLKYFQWGITREVGQLYDRPNLVPMEDEEVAAVIDVPGEAMDAKVAAIKAHETQIDFYHSLKSMFDYRTVAAREFFSLQRTRLEHAPGIETDLFAGVPGWAAGE